MASMSYWPTSEEDKPRLNIVQLEILVYYWHSPRTKYVDQLEFNSMNKIMGKEAQEAHLMLLENAMIEFADDTNELGMQNGTAIFELSPRGKEHIKRVLKMPLPVGRVVYTLPEEDN